MRIANPMVITRAHDHSGYVVAVTFGAVNYAESDEAPRVRVQLQVSDVRQWREDHDDGDEHVDPPREDEE